MFAVVMSYHYEEHPEKALSLKKDQGLKRMRSYKIEKNGCFYDCAGENRH